jgi:hypothetical protein
MGHEQNRKGAERLLTLKEGLAEVKNTMEAMKANIETIRNRHENGTAPEAVTSFNLFETPQKVVELMLSKIPHSVSNGVMNILEPSAGLGRIVTGLGNIYPWANITMVENAPQCAKHLYNSFNGELIVKDFLTVEPAKKFDLVAMNPPFKQGLDIKHIFHAYEFLKEGGFLVSLCYNGVKQNRNLKNWADSWEVLPEGSFKESGTGAQVALLTKAKRG